MQFCDLDMDNDAYNGVSPAKCADSASEIGVIEGRFPRLCLCKREMRTSPVLGRVPSKSRQPGAGETQRDVPLLKRLCVAVTLGPVCRDMRVTPHTTRAQPDRVNLQ